MKPVICPVSGREGNRKRCCRGKVQGQVARGAQEEEGGSKLGPR
jgi:hypothetical protein